MSADDRVRWDAIFQRLQSKPLPPPDPLLLQYTPPVPAMDVTWRALDCASGLGQNGLWLAEQGYYTDLMDISRVALKRARQTMTVRNLRNVNLLQIDVDNLRLDEHVYRLICVFRYYKKQLLSLLKRATEPGGRIIYETYNMRYLDQVPQFNTQYLLEVGELASFFADWHLIYREDDGHISRIVAVKP